MKLVSTLLAFLVSGICLAQPELAFTIAEKDFIPEGIAFNPADGSFFVGSIHKNKIVKISSAGVVSDFVASRKDSLGQVVGLRVDDVQQHLWVCSNEGEGLLGGTSFVHVYDLRSGQLIKKFKHQVDGETHFFNDVTLSGGAAYVSDSEFRAVFRVSLSGNKPELFVQSNMMFYANGIAALTGTTKIVVSAGNGPVLVDVVSREITRLPFKNYFVIGIDGLYQYNQSLIGVQNVVFPSSINQYFLNEEKNAITGARVLLADDPSFDLPTTGAIANGWFYFIANSQLGNYDKGVIADPDLLQEVKIMRIKLAP